MDTNGNAKRITISNAMAGAVTGAQTYNGGTWLRGVVRPGTIGALMARGLARYNREQSRETGYTVHTLTPRGLAMRAWLVESPERRSFDTQILDLGAIDIEVS